MHQSHLFHRPVKMLTAVAVVAAMMGADGGCEDRGSVHSDRPAADRQVDRKRQRTVEIRAESDSPYSVIVRAAKIGQDRGDYARETVAGGVYRQTLDYTSGQRITITITATGHPTDPLSCEISDGTHRSRDRAAGTVHCALTTSR